jgi:hypothetical protein
VRLLHVLSGPCRWLCCVLVKPGDSSRRLSVRVRLGWHSPLEDADGSRGVLRSTARAGDAVGLAARPAARRAVLQLGALLEFLLVLRH